MLTISTFNIFNDNNKDKYLEIEKYIKEYNIDILGLQEAYPKVVKKLSLTHQVTGKFRYLYFPRHNEANPIITNLEILKTKTKWLPYLPTLIPRIVTITTIKYNKEVINVINTHLAYENNQVQEKELNKLLEILKSLANPIILMGDFNLKNNNPIFINFINELEKLDIYQVPINEKTYKSPNNVRAIDHIFLSKKFKIDSYEVIKDLPISDHYPIIVKIN